jgi:hypothetical protein
MFYAGLLHFSDVVSPQQWSPVDAGLLYDILLPGLDANGISGIIASIVLITVQATMINYLVLEHRLGEDQNLFAGLFFILLASASPLLLHLSPVMLANTLIILAIGQLMNISKKNSAAEPIFNIGFCIGIAALLFPPYLIFVALAFAGISIMRDNSLNSLLTLLVGLLVPFFLATALIFLTDNLHAMPNYVEGIRLVKKVIAQGQAYEPIAVMTLYALVMVVALGFVNRLMGRKNIQIQKKISIIYWALLVGGLCVLGSGNLYPEQWLVVVIPAGILLGAVFSTLPGRWAESLHLMLLATVLIIQYKPFLLP